VNLSQRLQQWAEHGEIVLSEGTWAALPEPRPDAEPMEPALVKGRTTPVGGWKVSAATAVVS
jgi:class 3 adenylate cyclase